MAGNSPSEAGPSRLLGSPGSPASPSVLPLSIAQQAAPAVAIATTQHSPVATLPAIAAIVESDEQGVPDSWAARLHNLEGADKANAIVDLLNDHLHQAENVNASIAYVWRIVLADQLWEAYPGGRTKFFEDVSYATHIEPALQKNTECDFVKSRCLVHLADKWGERWAATIDQHGGNEYEQSERYLKNMSSLAGGMTLMHAKQLIDHVKGMRLSKSGRGIRKTQAVLASDIKKVMDAVAAVSQSQKILPADCAIDDLLSYLSTPEGKRITEDGTPGATPNASPGTVLQPPRDGGFSHQVPPLIILL